MPMPMHACVHVREADLVDSSPITSIEDSRQFVA